MSIKTPADFNLSAFVKAVAAHMPGWAYKKPSESQANVWEKIEKGGEVVINTNIPLAAHNYPRPAIYFHLNEREGKMTVGGEFIQANGNTYPYEAHKQCGSIGIGCTKTPEAAAKDITRRLVDAYLSLYAKGKDEFEKHENHDHQCKELAAEFAAIVGESRIEGHNVGWYVLPPGAVLAADENVWTVEKKIGVDIRVNSNTSVELKLSSLHPDEVRKILALFGKCPRETT